MSIPESVNLILREAAVRTHKLSVDENQLRTIIANLRASNINPEGMPELAFPTSASELADLLQGVLDTPKDQYHWDMLHGITL